MVVFSDVLRAVEEEVVDGFICVWACRTVGSSTLSYVMKVLVKWKMLSAELGV